MKLCDALNADRVVLDLAADDKVGVLQELLSRAGSALGLVDTGPLLQRVLDREAICSTAVNRGVAIPHARSPEIEGVDANLGIHRQGLDYDSPDGQPVHLVFLVLSSEIATPAYLSVLGRIARIFHREDMQQKLLAAASPQDIIQAIADQDPA
ncbi:MAG: PTS sugar transporter subunit IIA [bacterium]|nr:PTS sugar transporter subunit IIA [bacterium]